MKVDSYSVELMPTPGLWKRPCVLAHEGNKAAPLFYLQRPKWIKDDADWSRIVRSIELRLPGGFEIK